MVGRQHVTTATGNLPPDDTNAVMLLVSTSLARRALPVSKGASDDKSGISPNFGVHAFRELLVGLDIDSAYRCGSTAAGLLYASTLGTAFSFPCASSPHMSVLPGLSTGAGFGVNATPTLRPKSGAVDGTATGIGLGAAVSVEEPPSTVSVLN